MVAIKFQRKEKRATQLYLYTSDYRLDPVQHLI